MPKTTGSALRAVFFTDIVGSTELARELGDVRWARLLAVQRRIVREQLRAHRGREVDTAGDGFFALFESPTEGVRCALAAVRGVQEIGLDIRAGLHFGEVEIEGANAHGLVVHTGARVMSQAGASQVLITQTVRDLVAGARLETAERAPVELKGVPGTWTLFDVLGIDGVLRPEPIEHATVATERRERASAGAPRRARPRWIVPAVAATTALAAVAAFLMVRAGGEPIVPAGGTVARIDGDRFEPPIAVGATPLAMTEADGRMWVMDRRSQVYWVDEADGSTGSTGTDGIPTGAGAGEGAVWFTTGFGTGGPDAMVGQLDPGTGAISDAFRTPVGSEAIAVGGGAVWVADPYTASVTRYEPVAHESKVIRLRSSDEAAWPDSVAFGTLGGDAAWVGDGLTPNLYRVDAAAPYDVRTFGVGGPPTAIAVGPDAVWVVSGEADAVYALDPSSGGLRTTVDAAAEGCNEPVSVAVNAEGVWVACSQSQLVIRIDAASGSVAARLPVAGLPAALTVGSDGSVWVAVQAR